MTIFKENLTSKILQEETLALLNNFNSKKKILEIGCGNGNITRYLQKNQKFKNKFFCSDISPEATKFLRENFNYSDIEVLDGYLFDPWKNKKDYFDIIISDVSSISEPIAKKSDWYKGVVSDCGIDGLKNVNIILSEISNYLKKDGYFLLPAISLSDIDKLKDHLNKKFKEVLFTKKIYWPIPDFFKANLDVFQGLMDEKKIFVDYKFGSYYAFTHLAVCNKLIL